MAIEWKDSLKSAKQKAQQSSLNENSQNSEHSENILKILPKILSETSLSHLERIAIAQLIIRDGFNGGRISINSLKKLIGTTSNQTSIKILTKFENNEIIIRVRQKQFSTYKFTDKFVDHLKEDSSIII
ncbi:MAG: hypothetical protein C0173_00790 [Desulfurella sp.]|uniref:hypothetical protein n=1 Tax=Desulfurella sp. TaxID=1962857 RepID=UPI000CC07495|nr:hypothetical protein [Desulfurella sp.]PMP93418.1 MAG: hypothetical protein C0173_00790 [Desulfurella sp.]